MKKIVFLILFAITLIATSCAHRSGNYKKERALLRYYYQATETMLDEIEENYGWPDSLPSQKDYIKTRDSLKRYYNVSGN